MIDDNVLKSDIVDRVKNITNDCRSFLWLRSVHHQELSREELKLGGGNLLIVQGAFTAIEYLAKVYYCLKIDASRLPKRDDIYNPVAPDCFVYLIKDEEFPIKLGIESLSDKELKELWNGWRNKSCHFCVQNYSHSAISFMSVEPSEENESKYKAFINGEIGTRLPFEKIKTFSGWRCLIDILVRSIDEIAKYLAEEVLPKAEVENKKILRAWLDNNLLPDD